MIKKTICPICRKDMECFQNANFDLKKLDSYAFASRKNPEYMHYELYECKDCNYLMAIDTLKLSELASKYRSADFDSELEADYASKTYFKYLKNKCPDFPKGKVMDIGTGEGSYLKYLYLEGCKEIVGVEPSSAPISFADNLIKECIVNDVFRVEDYAANDFDMISLFQTIEHIPNPEQLCNDIHSLLKKEGIFYVVCHDYRSYVNRLLRTKSPIYDIEHLQLFSSKSIYRLLKKCNYSDINLFTIKNKYPLKYWIRLFPFPSGLKKILLKSAEKRKWGSIEIGINVGNIGIIARK